jgi:hypothetical protein
LRKYSESRLGKHGGEDYDYRYKHSISGRYAPPYEETPFRKTSEYSFERVRTKSMNKTARFIYREFYDVPRMLILLHRQMQLLLESRFDDGIDDYASAYDVFLLPNVEESELKGSWEELSRRATAHLGQIPVQDLTFDSTFRLEVETTPIDQLIDEWHTHS